MAHMPPGVITQFGRALRAPVGRIHWAGSETATVSHEASWGDPVGCARCGRAARGGMRLATIHQSRRRAGYVATMPRRGRALRARAVEWWRHCQADPEKRDFRRIGVVAFGVVGASVILAKVTQETPVAGYVRAFAITMFGLATIALLAVVLLMGEEMVDAMDETDPLRVRQGGAYGPRVKRFFLDLRSASGAWIKSRPAKVAALRHDLTRDSLARLAAASGAALGGIPPADAPSPAGAGQLAQPDSASPPPPENESASADTQPGIRAEPSPAARRVAASREKAAATRSSRSGQPVVARGSIKVRSSRTPRPTGRSERAGRTSNSGGLSTR
jgi:hypothetical protein